MYDIIIIGGGPAGLTAALYACRANKKTLVIEKETFGGQITFSPKVENIPGFISLTGNEFAEKLVEQVLEQGADVESCEALEIRDGEVKTVVTDDGEYQGKTVIIATGAKHRMLGIDGEDRFVGEGISFCAVCDGAFYKDKTVAVVGGGNSALQEAILLADTAKKVYVVQNLDFFTGEKKLVDQLERLDNIEIILGVTVDSFVGDNELEGVVIKNSAGETRSLEIDGLFVAIGLIPQNDAFKNVVTLDSRGYAEVDESCEAETNGIFVAGDCRTKKIRQVTTAAADGAIAALAACDYIDGLGK
ncbi:MAG: FAD-dependent oxidoreductase [Acutalibacteraceae bacterium]|nr:FAD-dependent oxidoreductase [Acutalibacteraceae bacterium]